MKTKFIIAAVAALSVTAAFAGDRMKKADVDADGQVTFAEFEAAQSARIAERFARMDKNADGVLTEDEMNRSRRDGRRNHHRRNRHGKMNPEKIVERLDQDGTGSLSFTELQGKRFSPDNQAFTAADTDGNGELNATELQAMMKARWAARHNSDQAEKY